MNFHGDVMLNLSNMICGYREDRLYSFIPYAGSWICTFRKRRRL